MIKFNVLKIVIYHINSNISTFLIIFSFCYLNILELKISIISYTYIIEIH